MRLFFVQQPKITLPVQLLSIKWAWWVFCPAFSQQTTGRHHVDPGNVLFSVSSLEFTAVTAQTPTLHPSFDSIFSTSDIIFSLLPLISPFSTINQVSRQCKILLSSGPLGLCHHPFIILPPELMYLMCLNYALSLHTLLGSIGAWSKNTYK